MKRILILSVVVLTIATAFRSLENIIARLGLQEQNAKSFILRDMVGRLDTTPIDESDLNLTDSEYDQTKVFQIPAAPMLTAVITGDRKAAARELCEYVKAYVNSPEFRTDYERIREASKPTEEPAGMDAATLEATKSAVNEMEKQYETLKASKQVPESALAEFKKTIAGMKAKLATMDDPSPYLTRWTKLYPEDPKILVKARLNEYLQLLATVDFDAKTSGSPKNQKFINPVYEKKSLKWKAIYRAGKDVNEVASAFAKEWLKEGL